MLRLMTQESWYVLVVICIRPLLIIVDRYLFFNSNDLHVSWPGGVELGDDAGHLKLICARDAEIIQPTSVRRENGGSQRLVV